MSSEPSIYRFDRKRPDVVSAWFAEHNLWVSVSGGQIWDFGSASTAPFRYGGVVYSSLAGFAAASGLETAGRQINRTTCFATLDVPGPAAVPIPAPYMTLKAGCSAVDAGAILPNLNDGFVGAAPDLGAYELGQPVSAYGPRIGAPPQAPRNFRIVRF